MIDKSKRKLIAARARLNKQEKYKQSFSKKWIARLFWCVIIWITLSYVLAFIGKDNIAENLSSQVVLIGLGAMFTYFPKSFLETREQERNRIKEKQIDFEQEIAEEVITDEICNR